MLILQKIFTVFYRFTTLTVLLAVIASNANAAEQENHVINKMLKAYGGNNLIKLNSLIINNKYKTLDFGRSASPDVIDINLRNTLVKIDFNKKQSSIESWSKSNNGVRLGRNFNNGKSGHSINFMRGTHVDRPDYTYYRVAGGSMRMLDTALVKVLLEVRDTAQFKGDVLYRGKKHHTLSFKMPESSALTLYVDHKTGLISKMTRPGDLTYLFADYKTQSGLTYASNVNFLIAGQADTISLSRSIEVNPILKDAFEMPEGITTIPGGMLDTSKMTVQKIADSVYLSGQRSGFSIFVDTHDYFIASGGSPGLLKRFAAVKKYLGTNKPLKYFVVAQHHVNRTGGDDVNELGANIVSVKNHIPSIKKSLTQEVDDERFVLVDGKMSLADGKVQVIDISTSYAEQFLLVYLPEAKLAFGARHFSTQVTNALPGPSNHAVSYLNALESLNLDIETLYDAHTPRMFTLEDLRSVAAKYNDRTCLPGFKICADY